MMMIRMLNSHVTIRYTVHTFMSLTVSVNSSFVLLDPGKMGIGVEASSYAAILEFPFTVG